MSRGPIHVAISIVLVTVLGSACSRGGSSGSGSSGELTFVSWGGSYQEAETNAWIAPYEREAGTKVLQDSPTEYSKLRAMVEAGHVTWDVVDVEGDFGLDVDAKYLEPIDYSVVDKGTLLEGIASTYRVGVQLYSVVLGYNADVLGSSVPSGWADFFDSERFTCKRAAQKRASSGILEIALLADGVSPADIYPIDVDRALRKLDAIKDKIVWFDTGSQAQQLLASGEVCMAAIFNGRAYAAKTADHAPVGVVWDQQVVSADYLVVPKGSPHKDAAMKLIAYIVSPKSQARLPDYIPYAPVNTRAVADPAIASWLPTTHLVSSLRFDDAWWASNFSAVDQQFQSWLLS